jgi:nitroimidazol reductase NimA-like FMN-containing flavoprotein (pyridoxamine 5'-phosphate oxidase superfamily)
MLGELNPQQIDQLLRAEVIGRLGCHADGRTYVVPVTYAYDGHDIYGHTGEGLKLRMMRANPQVCFEVEHIDNLANWQSAIVWGTFEELYGAELERAMALLLTRLLPVTASESSQPFHGQSGTDVDPTHTGDGPARMYRIRISDRSGRFEKR